MEEKKEKPKRERELIEGAIPDYDFMFVENGEGKKPKKKSAVSNIVKVLAMDKKMFWLNILGGILQNLPAWFIPLCTANILNAVSVALQTGEGISNAVLTDIALNLGFIAFVLLINFPCTVWRWSLTSTSLRRTNAGIKSSVIRKLQSLSITYVKDMQTGKIQSKFLKDTDEVYDMLYFTVNSFVLNVLNTIVAFGISLYRNGLVSLFFLFAIPANIFITMRFRNKIVKGYRELRTNTEKMSSKVSTMIEMMPVTKAHGLEDKEINEVSSYIKEVAGSGKRIDLVNAKFGSWMYVISQSLSIICLMFCVYLTLKRIIGVGDIVLYQNMFTSLTAYVSILIGSIPILGKGAEAVNSISEIMNVKEVEMNIGKREVPTVNGEIEFKNVSYKYPHSDEYVVKDFSLHVKPGECIAFVGPSGSGKSTIMNMIIGFLPPVNGELLIDGKNIKDVNLSEYRHYLSVVPQSSILFGGTVKDNITYGLDNYSQEQLDKVLEMANVNEFLHELPDGINTNIGEHGEKFSGGQKQRITIARALIRDPRVLILDEATSALDNISEYHVQKAIESSVKGRTTFIVAHRLSTIRNADRIVVMEQGRCVECGTYNELMALKGKFFELKNLNDITIKNAEKELS